MGKKFLVLFFVCGFVVGVVDSIKENKKTYT